VYDNPPSSKPDFLFASTATAYRDSFRQKQTFPSAKCLLPDPLDLKQQVYDDSPLSKPDFPIASTAAPKEVAS
jgi:hypothetical protein